MVNLSHGDSDVADKDVLSLIETERNSTMEYFKIVFTVLDYVLGLVMVFSALLQIFAAYALPANLVKSFWEMQRRNLVKGIDLVNMTWTMRVWTIVFIVAVIKFDMVYTIIGYGALLISMATFFAKSRTRALDQ